MPEQISNIVGLVIVLIIIGFGGVVVLSVAVVLIMARLGIFDCFKEV